MESHRTQRWAATMHGQLAGAFRLAHDDSAARVALGPPQSRAAREALERATLADGATLSSGAGNRRRNEAPDEMRTCFQRDRDRILHSSAFRRLAGKTQVFIFPADHQRTRLTHAIEVAQVATSIGRALRLNVALVEAIALGHDCGHGPGGHASEDALSPYVAEGYDHAVWGADVVLDDLNLCAETLDGIRNHSWSRPAPGTPEGEVVSWADRIAYVCHDFEDATEAGIATLAMLPEAVRAACGNSRREQLASFISAVVETASSHGVIGMTSGLADALAGFRAFNYEHIYLRPASQRQAQLVIEVLRALVESYADRPNLLPHGRGGGLAAGSDDALRCAVGYVAGMTDRFAVRCAVSQLGWDVTKLQAFSPG
ncbi:MAG: HD domain-containing protein [Acidimicrobiales bacterium]